jgi:iron(III) transport system permease protein
MAQLARIRSDSLIQGITSWAVVLMILAPVSVLLSRSFYIEQQGAPIVFTLRNFKTVFTNEVILYAIGNTLMASLGSTLFATVVGVTLAWLNMRTNLPARPVLHVCNTIPFYLSPYVGAIAWTYLAAPRTGLLNSFAFHQFGLPADLFNVYGIPGIIWVQGIFFTPIVYLMTSGTFAQMDPAFEESSRSCGRGTIYTTLRITLPLALPSILSAVILTFVSSAGEFGVPLTLGVPRNYETLSTLIFEVIQRAQPDYSLAACMATILAVATVSSVLLHRYMILRRNYTTVTGRGYRPAVIDLGRWRWAAFAFSFAFFLIGVGLPLFALVLQSLQHVWLGSFLPKQFTWFNYPEVLTYIPETLSGIKNSFILALSGATIGIILSLLVSQAIYRSRLPGRRLIDMTSSLPVGVPGIAFAMGILLISIRTPLYGSLVVLLIAYLARFLPLAQRSVGGVLLSLSPELEEASRACGSGYGRTLVRITLPLIKPGMVAAWVLLFVIFLRELPISILLWQAGTETMSVALWQLMQHATSGKVAAYAMMHSGMILIVVVVFQLFVRTRVSGAAQ